MAPWRSKQTKPEHEMILQEADLASMANVEKKELLQSKENKEHRNQMQHVDPVQAVIHANGSKTYLR